MDKDSIDLLSDMLLDNGCNPNDTIKIMNKMLEVREAKESYLNKQNELRELLFKTIGKDYLIIR
ncbi:hypothetical protein ACUH7Y_07020 [Clostridium beijerinckii]|uniref:Uncharacterized protein n=1 Tax=Clostridium beijerinckii TaxID=1520 RepID=A0A7X9SQP6_CLOBE|nr:hypothetical protein [Clostridium beijerinckii]NMF06270.1 hypothetical protein [Clostridium beijerinckii]